MSDEEISPEASIAGLAFAVEQYMEDQANRQNPAGTEKNDGDEPMNKKEVTGILDDIYLDGPDHGCSKIGAIENYYGGIWATEVKGRYFWTIHNYCSEYWEEIPESLYKELIKFEANRVTDENGEPIFANVQP